MLKFKSWGHYNDISSLASIYLGRTPIIGFKLA